MKKLTPEEVYHRLLDDYDIKSIDGKIQFMLGDVDIIVKQKDVVGNIVQEWLEGCPPSGVGDMREVCVNRQK